MAMWDIYGKGDGTLAIKSDVGKLKAVFEASDQRAFLARVAYISWDEMATWPNNVFVQCFRKDRSYEHEVEVRAVISTLDLDPSFNRARSGIEVDFEPSKLITQVVVGPREQGETAGLVRNILKRYDLAIPLTSSNRLKRRG